MKVVLFIVAVIVGTMVALVVGVPASFITSAVGDARSGGSSASMTVTAAYLALTVVALATVGLFRLTPRLRASTIGSSTSLRWAAGIVAWYLLVGVTFGLVFGTQAGTWAALLAGLVIIVAAVIGLTPDEPETTGGEPDEWELLRAPGNPPSCDSGRDRDSLAQDDATCAPR